MRIIFFGTPEFAVTTLQELVAAGKNIVAVVTATDKLGGRDKKQLIQSPVKQFALSQLIPVLQPEKLKNPDFIIELESYRADIQIVVAFRMLPEIVWAMPQKGTFNIHGSLLPKYRGAAPINWAIINGETETGVTSFFLKHEVDTGDLLLQAKTPILPSDNFGTMYEKLKHLGAEIALKTIEAIEQNKAHPFPQDESQASTAPKIFRETCEINFEQSAQKIVNFVRGLSPVPTAWTTLHQQALKVFVAQVEIAQHNFPCGKYFSDQKTYMKVACADGYVHLLEIQLENKKRMDIRSFLNGYNIVK